MFTKREKFLLCQVIEHDVYRYLMSNTYGREDGCEKAERHINISSSIVSFILCEKYSERKHTEIMMEVHDYLAEILTDRMDEVIGFPIYDKRPDYDELVIRFMNVILDNLGNIEIMIKNFVKAD